MCLNIAKIKFMLMLMHHSWPFVFTSVLLALKWTNKKQYEISKMKLGFEIQDVDPSYISFWDIQIAPGDFDNKNVLQKRYVFQVFTCSLRQMLLDNSKITRTCGQRHSTRTTVAPSVSICGITPTGPGSVRCAYPPPGTSMGITKTNSPRYQVC